MLRGWDFVTYNLLCASHILDGIPDFVSNVPFDHPAPIDPVRIAVVSSVNKFPHQFAVCFQLQQPPIHEFLDKDVLGIKHLGAPFINRTHIMFLERCVPRRRNFLSFKVIKYNFIAINI